MDAAWVGITISVERYVSCKAWSIVPVKDRELSHCRMCAFTVIGTRFKIACGGSRQGTATSRKRNSSRRSIGRGRGSGNVTGGVRQVAASTTGVIRTEFLVIQDSKDRRE